MAKDGATADGKSVHASEMGSTAWENDREGKLHDAAKGGACFAVAGLGS